MEREFEESFSSTSLTSDNLCSLSDSTVSNLCPHVSQIWSEGGAILKEEQGHLDLCTKLAKKNALGIMACLINPESIKIKTIQNYPRQRLAIWKSPISRTQI